MTALLKKYQEMVRKNNGRSGFTLIELLIVMAILGVLAVVVLVAINPAEQMRRARDSGRISGVNQIGRAITAYYTANGCLPGVAGQPAPCPATADLEADLLASEELNSFPAEITPVSTDDSCTSGTPYNGWCYAEDGVEFFVLFDGLESEQRKNACPTAGDPAYAGFSADAGRGGVWCSAEPGVTADPPDY